MIRNVSEVPLSPFLCRRAMYIDRDIINERGYYFVGLCFAWGGRLEEVHFNMGMWEDLKVVNICVIFKNSV